MYRTQLERIEPSTHWDVGGSLFFAFTVLTAVSYTHLTLPTILLV